MGNQGLESEILVSPTGSVWSRRILFQAERSVQASGKDGKAILAGRTPYSSSDGFWWLPFLQSTISLPQAEAIGDTFYFFSSDQRFRSADGVTWEVGSYLTSLEISFPNGLSFNGNRFAKLKYFSLVVETSGEGFDWERQFIANTNGVSYIALTWGNNRFLAVGQNGQFAYSTTALTGSWTTGIINQDIRFSNVSYTGNLFFAFGTDSSNADANMAFTSPNGSSWTRLTLPILAVEHNGTHYVGICEQGGGIYSSLDGNTWTHENARLCDG